VVLATGPETVDEGSGLAAAWHAALDGLWVAPIEASGEIVLGWAASTGDRALDPIVVCGMGYDADEIDAATAPTVERLSREETAWRGGPPLDLGEQVVAVIDGTDPLAAAAAQLGARHRGAGRVLLADVSEAEARAGGFDGATPPIRGRRADRN
jgi:predicted phosphoribosyltransferase